MAFVKDPGFNRKFKVDGSLDSNLQMAEAIVYSSYGDVVSVVDKAKSLAKFGRHSTVGTSFSVVSRTDQLTSGAQTYSTTNDITTISSSSASDTTQVITIEGHTISNGLLTFVVQSVTLNGQNKVTLTTPLARCTRALSANPTALAGNVYIYRDTTVSGGVPTTLGNVVLYMPVGNNQSEKAATSVSKSDYWFITKFTGFCFDKTAAIVEYEIRIREVSTANDAFRTIYQTSGANGVPTFDVFNPVLIIPKNHDVEIRAKADGANTDVGARMAGYLAIVNNS